MIIILLVLVLISITIIIQNRVALLVCSRLSNAASLVLCVVCRVKDHHICCIIHRFWRTYVLDKCRQVVPPECPLNLNDFVPRTGSLPGDWPKKRKISVAKLAVRPISLLRLSLLRLLDLNFPGHSLWAWEFQPLNYLCFLSQALGNPESQYGDRPYGPSCARFSSMVGWHSECSRAHNSFEYGVT